VDVGIPDDETGMLPMCCGTLYGVVGIEDGSPPENAGEAFA